MNAEVMEVWASKLKNVNDLILTSFCFEVSGQVYISFWNKLKWEEPFKVVKL